MMRSQITNHALRSRRAARLPAAVLCSVIAYALSFTSLFGPVHEFGHGLVAVLLGGNVGRAGWAWINVSGLSGWREDAMLVAGAGFELLFAAFVTTAAAVRHKPAMIGFGTGWFAGCWVFSRGLQEWRALSYPLRVQQTLWVWYGIVVLVAGANAAVRGWYYGWAMSENARPRQKNAELAART